jgi:hypothetical protein
LDDLVRHQTSSLGKKKSSVNQEDWEAILAFILVGAAPDRAAITEDVEAEAKVDGNLIITVQKNVQGIKVCEVRLVTNITL